MVDFTGLYDEFDDEFVSSRTSSPISERKRVSAKRELSGQERCSTRARFSRQKGNPSSIGGKHRRRGRRSLV